jgi:hypothetical protein
MTAVRDHCSCWSHHGAKPVALVPIGGLRSVRAVVYHVTDHHHSIAFNYGFFGGGGGGGGGAGGFFMGFGGE